MITENQSGAGSNKTYVVPILSGLSGDAFQVSKGLVGNINMVFVSNMRFFPTEVYSKQCSKTQCTSGYKIKNKFC